MITLKKIETNLHKVELTNYTLFFSYETVVAYIDKYNDRLVVSENIWSKTTAKHINKIKSQWYGEANVVSHDIFESALYIMDV